MKKTKKYMSLGKVRRCIVVVMAVQWGYPGDRVQRWFRINPANHSGARLIRLIGHGDFFVTNACRDIVYNASEQGTPDPEWLARNLKALEPDVVIVCGKVAGSTFHAEMVPTATHIIHIPHPAARMWSKKLMARYTKLLQGVLS
jgi:hypothetical protein